MGPLAACDRSPSYRGLVVEGLTLGGRLAQWLWGLHYRVPEPYYWLLLSVSLLLSFGLVLLEAFALALVGLPVAGAAVGGIVRWDRDRHRCRGALVLPRFRTPSGQEARAEDVQRQMSATLQDNLTPAEADRVQVVPAVLGPDERDLAVRLRRRLRAKFLVYGRISDEGKSIEAGVMEPVRELIVHFDSHTRDVTVRKAPWRQMFRGLSPDRDVVDTQYPPSATQDIEALVRGMAGLVALEEGDDVRAERLLREAIKAAPASTSQQMDQLRVSLADALVGQERHMEAISVLRQRSSQKDASPELLRALHALLFVTYGSPRQQGINSKAAAKAEKQSERALRAAAEFRSDPGREMTLYNLATLIDPSSSASAEEEVEALVEELLSPSSGYRRAWYVHSRHGALAWRRFQRAEAMGDEALAVFAAKAAAKAYSRAIRLRPRVKLWLWSDTGFKLFPPPIPRSAVLHANAYDARHFAGHRARSLWHRERARYVMQKRWKRGIKMMGRSEWGWAYENFNWIAAVGWVNPLATRARVFAAAALQQLGEDQRASAEWQAVLASDPEEARSVRRQLAADLPGYGLSRGLPGPLYG